MELTKDFLDNFSNNYNEVEIFGHVHTFLVQEGVFQVLEDKNCLTFHEKIFEIVKHPHGLGVALSIIPIVNLAGTLLMVAKENSSSLAQDVLQSIQEGSIIPAVGVSEKNWQGRLSKLQTKLTQEEDHYLLNGSKSFITNALSCTHFLIVARLEEKYKLVFLPREEKGIQVNYFTLSFARECTHASLELTNVKIKPEWILPLDYSTWGEKARISEIFSLSFIVNSYLKLVTHKLIPIAMEKEAWKNTYENQRKTFELFQLLDMQKSHLDFISVQRSGENFLTYPLETKYPFGLPTIIKNFLEFWKGVFTQSELIENFPDLELIFYYDFEKDFSLKKSVRTFYHNLFQISGEQFLVDF